MVGLAVVNPNERWFWCFSGSTWVRSRTEWFFLVQSIDCQEKKSLRARNFDGAPIKVNDSVGNPIMIGLVLVWKVENTFKAAFEVDEFEHFVTVQSDAALTEACRHLSV
jgi:hypothetical protein